MIAAAACKGEGRGEARALRQATIVVLEERGLSIPAWVVRGLDREDYPPRLAMIHRAALTVGADFEDLFPYSTAAFRSDRA